MNTETTNRMTARLTFNGRINHHRVAEVRERIEHLRQVANRIDWYADRTRAWKADEHAQSRRLYARAERIEAALEAAIGVEVDGL